MFIPWRQGDILEGLEYGVRWEKPLASPWLSFSRFGMNESNGVNRKVD